MNKIIVYGIPTCDVTKKALAWLKQNNLVFNFHDYKKEGITAAKLNNWSKVKSWEMLLNKRGTTWKTIDPAIQQVIIDQKSAVQLMLSYTSLIKRPLIEAVGTILIGYNEAAYQEVLLKI
ncbi:MAG: Spx/MgsR family RNA polymerase-binding regulatory protein [Ferruginibacter sp.]|nr:Spx/MgsR family RNA polymerase-binding regulatory protein [Ferruginibacter sp.]